MAKFVFYLLIILPYLPGLQGKTKETFKWPQIWSFAAGCFFSREEKKKKEKPDIWVPTVSGGWAKNAHLYY